jgi:glutathione S-transferase
MPDAPDITLYFSVFSRGFTPRWLLEELDVPYRVKMVDIRENRQKSPEYLRINPMGKVPALMDHGQIITENPAICIYLADRYGMGTLAPAIDDPDRGPYLRWMVFSTAVFEPAAYLEEPQDDASARGRGWGKRDTVLAILDDLLAKGPWILGERFSAADVMLGSLVAVTLFNKRVPETPTLKAYNERLAARPACQRAMNFTWPPELIAALNVAQS